HELAFDERFRASFQQEARVIAALSHENIVQVYDTEQAYATYFIMMEFIAGTSLAKLIETSGRLPASQVRDILIQMCRALGFAHDRGIVHRDVKPSNAIMTPDGRVKLMDFGLARVQAAEPKAEDERLLTQGRAAGLPSAREGKVITIFYAPSEAGSVERAIVELRQSLGANPNVRLATSTLTAPT